MPRTYVIQDDEGPVQEPVAVEVDGPKQISLFEASFTYMEDCGYSPRIIKQHEGLALPQDAEIIIPVTDMEDIYELGRDY